MAFQQLSFQLIFQNGNGFMHLRRAFDGPDVIDIFIKNLRLEIGARIFAVHIHRKVVERAQMDAIAIFQHVKGVVFDSVAKDGHDASFIA